MLSKAETGERAGVLGKQRRAFSIGPEVLGKQRSFPGGLAFQRALGRGEWKLVGGVRALFRPVASRFLDGTVLQPLPERAHVGALGAPVGDSRGAWPTIHLEFTRQSAQATSQARYSLRTKRTMIGMPGEAMNR